MEKFVYALFANTAAADGVVAKLASHGMPRDVVSLVVHTGRLDSVIQGPGTRSRRNAWIGGIGAGLLATVTAGIAAYALDIAVFPTALIAGAGFGLLAALVSAIAGTAIPRRALTRLGREVAAGRILVTVDLASKRAATDMVRRLRDTEALRAGML